MSRSWAVSTFWETVPMDFFSSPNRLVPGSRSRRISTFHLSPMRDRVVSTGQAGSSFPFTWLMAKTPSFLLVTYLLILPYRRIGVKLPVWDAAVAF